MDGIINCYKPEGMTSFDVVARVRKILHIKKVGHTGTLDPAAAGVLPICVGKATKLIDFIMQGDKCYRVEMTLGVVTDTYDREGKILSLQSVNVSDEKIKEAMMKFKGEIMQVPPMYSALKHNGRKLYELARAGIEVERQPREINIYDLNIFNIHDNKVLFDVVCSKGTYIRSLCYDIGNELGCGAMMSNLIRVYSGKFKIEDSIDINKLNEENIFDHIISIEKVFDELPQIKVNSRFKKLFVNGVNIKDKSFIDDMELSKYRVYNENDTLIGIGEKNNCGFKALLLV
ncbi:tRNA pseudouridine(55) synthase TruB [Clostridium oryzae]|uniref:tRNA pseudouridine synthase B n=1 Tax=Clostridium oryzae TaxID=1450648 RepID=A0A1V4IPS6_9CLOT|nr:tRNA pseudouridine(55) synthase TruB [Clostridium oryzae]OPJ61814.1 tRNA pseudouridine synthase B [Clostridium oryzae]